MTPIEPAARRAAEERLAKRPWWAEQAAATRIRERWWIFAVIAFVVALGAFVTLTESDPGMPVQYRNG
jgi:hypothetical protein